MVVIVLGLAYPGFKAARDTMSTSGFRDRMERSGDRIVAELTTELRSSRVTDLAASPAPPSLTLVRPERGVALDALDAEGSVPWSADARVVRFRPLDTLSEAAEGEDLNGDGDRADTYATGTIEVVADGLARPIVPSARVLLGLPGYTADLDGDGQPDPLFTRDGRDLVIELHLVVRTDDGRLLTTVVHGRLHLRNEQQ